MKKLLLWAFTLLLVSLLFLPTRVATAQLIATLEGHTDNVWSVAFGPDGKTLASASFDSAVRLWEVPSGKLLHVLTGHTNTVHSVSFSPDGQTLASGGWESTIRLWDPSSGTLKRTLTSPGGVVGSAIFSPDGRILAVGGGDGVVYLWNTTTWQVEDTLTGHTHVIDFMAFSDNGSMLASASRDRTARVWNIHTGEHIRTFTEHSHEVFRVAFSPDGSMLASSSRDGIISLWDLDTGQLEGTTSGRSMVFSPDGSALVIGGEVVSFWEIDVQEHIIGSIGGVGELMTITYSPDGRLIAAGGIDNSAYLWGSTPAQLPFSDVPFDINNIPQPIVPPAAVVDFFELTPFYQQWINVAGFPVLASEEVNPYAVKEAAWIIWQMIGHQPDILKVLARSRKRFTVLAVTESFSDTPEYEASFNFPTKFMEAYVRDVNCNCPITLASEEHLLYSGLGVPPIIHEFAHTIHEGLNRMGREFDNRLRATYEAAMEEGLYRGFASSTNRDEYWAEGSQSWFNASRSNVPKTRAALKTYDPDLAKLLAETFGDGDWRYTPPDTRLHLPHLQELNPQDFPKVDGSSPWAIGAVELEEQVRDPNSDGGGKWVDLKLYHPSQLPRLIESTTGGGDTAFIWVNLTGGEISFYTVDVDGTERWVYTAATKLFYHGNTHVGAIWLIKDHKGEDLAVFRAVEKVGRVLISPTSIPITADVNSDGSVNVLDLVVIASALGNAGTNLAVDVNGDGAVNVLDLILVAGMFDGATAAPSASSQVPETLTAVEVQGWLTDARALEMRDLIMKRGFVVLEQLLISLTPKETELLANYPNPFNPETWIPYRLAEDAFVTLTIYDLNGRVVRTLEVGHRIASAYENRSKAIYWDGRNEGGEQVASGVYFYTLSAGDYSATQKMVILK